MVDGAPDPNAVEGEGGAATTTPTDTETSFQRSYEMGREVAVTATRPGGLVKLSVAVAVSEAALEAAAPLTAEQVQDLVSAAVGASEDRGDQVQVVVSAFESTELEPIAFYEQPWFAMAVRYSAALLAVLLVLMLAVRPLIKRVKSPGGGGDVDHDSETAALTAESSGSIARATSPGAPTRDLPQQVELARRLASTQPDRAVEALQRMLEPPGKPSPDGAA